MNILVIGCRTMGSHLASILSREGHDVSVIDKDEQNFELLDNDFSGLTVTGLAIDTEVLRRAGIEVCDAVAAVSSDDNQNIMVSQIAKEVFKVPRVLTRIYDPQRTQVFTSFSLHTVCPTNLAVDAIHAILTDSGEVQQMTFDSSTLSFTTVPMPREWVGRRSNEVKDTLGVLFGVLHPDGSMDLAGEKTVNLTAQDRLVFTKVVD